MWLCQHDIGEKYLLILNLAGVLAASENLVFKAELLGAWCSFFYNIIGMLAIGGYWR